MTGLLLKSAVHVAYLIPARRCAPASSAPGGAPRIADRPGWYLAQAARAHDAPLLVIARDNHGANQLEADLQTLLGGDPAVPVVAFPDWETLPYDRFSPHPDIISQRLAALHRLPR